MIQLEKPHAGSIFRPLLAQITYHDFQPIKKDIWVNFKPSSQYNFMQKKQKSSKGRFCIWLQKPRMTNFHKIAI